MRTVPHGAPAPPINVKFAMMMQQRGCCDAVSAGGWGGVALLAPLLTPPWNRCGLRCAEHHGHRQGQCTVRVDLTCGRSGGRVVRT